MQNTCSRLYYCPERSHDGERTMKTVKPTENQLEMAIVAAEQLLDSGQDEHHMAAALIYLYQRLQDLERVREIAGQLATSGPDQERMTELAGALEAVRGHKP